MNDGSPFGALKSKEVKGIADKRPRRYPRSRLTNQTLDAGDEFLPVGITAEDLRPLYPPCHDVVKSTGSIESGMAWHERSISPVGRSDK